MKINPLLQKFESQFTSLKSKQDFHRYVSKDDIVSIIYYDVEKEQVRLQQFTGVCKKFVSKGINSKIVVVNTIGKITIEQQFFLYSKVVSDVVILRKMSKRKNPFLKKGVTRQNINIRDERFLNGVRSRRIPYTVEGVKVDGDDV